MLEAGTATGITDENDEQESDYTCISEEPDTSGKHDVHAAFNQSALSFNTGN